MQERGESQISFEEKYQENLLGEKTTEDGTRIVSYLLEYIPWDDKEKPLADFVLEALSSGFEEAASPIVLGHSTGGQYLMGGMGIMTQVIFFLRKK